MNSLSRSQPKSGPECGQCQHWSAGLCYRFPPQMVPFPSDNQQPISYWPAALRPEVLATERACGEYLEAKHD